MRQDIQKSLGIKAYDIYGLTELSGPGVAYECSAQTGMHINEDHFIAEIIDPDTGEVLPEGTQGELVFTSHHARRRFPLLRYRTRDICMLTPREHAPAAGRMSRCAKPMGRSDDMLIVKGVNVFPSQIETVLLEQGYPSNYQIVVDRVNNSDTLEVHGRDDAGALLRLLWARSREMEKSLVAALKAMLGIYAKVHLVAPEIHRPQRGQGRPRHRQAQDLRRKRLWRFIRFPYFWKTVPGSWLRSPALLAENNIDLRAINIAETSDYGVLRLIASHEPEAVPRTARERIYLLGQRGRRRRRAG